MSLNVSVATVVAESNGFYWGWSHKYSYSDRQPIHSKLIAECQTKKQPQNNILATAILNLGFEVGLYFGYNMGVKTS